MLDDLPETPEVHGSTHYLKRESRYWLWLRHDCDYM